jgi:hypothetical protein
MTAEHGLGLAIGRLGPRSHVAPFALWCQVFDLTEAIARNRLSQWSHLREALRSLEAIARKLIEEG